MRPLPAPLSAVKKEQGTERRPAAASPAVRQPAGAEAASRPAASGRRRAVSGGAVRFPVASPGARGAGSASGAPLRLVQERSLPDVGGAVSVSRRRAQNGCERRARSAFWSREASPSPARVRPGTSSRLPPSRTSPRTWGPAGGCVSPTPPQLAEAP